LQKRPPPVIIGVMERPDTELEVFLLQRTGERDRGSFEQLYERFSGVIFSTALQVLGNQQSAEDVLQEVFVSIWEKAPLYDSERGKPITWALSLARHKAIDRLRSLLGICFCARRAVDGKHTDRRRGVRGSDSDGSGTAVDNTATGYEALYLNVDGTSNAAFGYEALYGCTIDSEETATGYQALYRDNASSALVPNKNVADGYQALYSNTNGYENAATGYQALYGNISGYHNTAMGYEALTARNLLLRPPRRGRQAHGSAPGSEGVR
jgi:RNA polymerase sigma factor (sigma-70 family)